MHAKDANQDNSWTDKPTLALHHHKLATVTKNTMLVLLDVLLAQPINSLETSTEDNKAVDVDKEMFQPSIAATTKDSLEELLLNAIPAKDAHKDKSWTEPLTLAMSDKSFRDAAAGINSTQSLNNVIDAQLSNSQETTTFKMVLEIFKVELAVKDPWILNWAATPRVTLDLIKTDVMLANHAKPDINSTQPLILAFVQDQHVIATNPTTQSLISVMIVDKEDGVKMPSVESKPTNAELLH